MSSKAIPCAPPETPTWLEPMWELPKGCDLLLLGVDPLLR